MSYVRCRKVQGKHHMYCPVRKKAVVLGKDCDDGDVANLTAAQAKAVEDNASWKVLDVKDENEVLAEEAGPPDGLLILVSKGGGWFDVQNTATGETINTTSLRLEDAEALITEYKVKEGDESDDGEVADEPDGDNEEDEGGEGDGDE